MTRGVRTACATCGSTFHVSPDEWAPGLRCDACHARRWLGFNEGHVVAEYPNQAAANIALEKRQVQSVAPAVQ